MIARSSHSEPPLATKRAEGEAKTRSSPDATSNARHALTAESTSRECSAGLTLAQTF